MLCDKWDMDHAVKAVYEEGFEEGREEGARLEFLKTVKCMRDAEFEPEQISIFTGHSIVEVYDAIVEIEKIQN